MNREEIIKEFEKRFKSEFPEWCKKEIYEPWTLYKEEFEFSADYKCGVTFAPTDHSSAFNLEPSEKIRLKKLSRFGIYRAIFVIEDLQYLLQNDANPDLFKQCFEEFLSNINNNRLKNITVIKGSFCDMIPESNTLVRQLEDPRYIELRYWFNY